MTLKLSTIVNTTAANNPTPNQYMSLNSSGLVLGSGMHMMPSQTTFMGSKDNRRVTVDEIIDFMDVMKERMLLLAPLFEKHEHYPALKAAYEHYLMVEKLCNGDDESGV